MDPVLTVNNLTKIFTRQGRADLTAVDHVSFTLHRGECLGIIGESGSGKSTVAGMITRLLDPTEGTVILDDEDITKARGRALRSAYRKMQMVFQTPAESFDPRRTLGDGICESLINSGKSREEVKREVARLLSQCGLTPDFAGRYPHEVSGGQCQRAAIARALAIKPMLLICDEATSAERGEGLSILFICHDIALVQRFCDRVLVMHKGKVVERGTPDEIIQQPKEDYTRRLIDSVL